MSNLKRKKKSDRLDAIVSEIRNRSSNIPSEEDNVVSNNFPIQEESPRIVGATWKQEQNTSTPTLPISRSDKNQKRFPRTVPRSANLSPIKSYQSSSSPLIDERHPQGRLKARKAGSPILPKRTNLVEYNASPYRDHDQSSLRSASYYCTSSELQSIPENSIIHSRSRSRINLSHIPDDSFKEIIDSFEPRHRRTESISLSKAEVISKLSRESNDCSNSEAGSLCSTESLKEAKVYKKRATNPVNTSKRIKIKVLDSQSKNPIDSVLKDSTTQTERFDDKKDQPNSYAVSGLKSSFKDILSYREDIVASVEKSHILERRHTIADHKSPPEKPLRRNTPADYSKGIEESEKMPNNNPELLPTDARIVSDIRSKDKLPGKGIQGIARQIRHSFKKRISKKQQNCTTNPSTDSKEPSENDLQSQKEPLLRKKSEPNAKQRRFSFSSKSKKDRPLSNQLQSEEFQLDKQMEALSLSGANQSADKSNALDMALYYAAARKYMLEENTNTRSAINDHGSHTQSGYSPYLQDYPRYEREGIRSFNNRGPDISPQNYRGESILQNGSQTFSDQSSSLNSIYNQPGAYRRLPGDSRRPKAEKKSNRSNRRDSNSSREYSDNLHTPERYRDGSHQISSKDLQDSSYSLHRVDRAVNLFGMNTCSPTDNRYSLYPGYIARSSNSVGHQRNYDLHPRGKQSWIDNSTCSLGATETARSTNTAKQRNNSFGALGAAGMARSISTVRPRYQRYQPLDGSSTTTWNSTDSRLSFPSPSVPQTETHGHGTVSNPVFGISSSQHEENVSSTMEISRAIGRKKEQDKGARNKSKKYQKESKSELPFNGEDIPVMMNQQIIDNARNIRKTNERNGLIPISRLSSDEVQEQPKNERSSDVRSRLVRMRKSILTKTHSNSYDLAKARRSFTDPFSDSENTVSKTRKLRSLVNQVILPVSAVLGRMNRPNGSADINLRTRSSSELKMARRKSSATE